MRFQLLVAAIILGASAAATAQDDDFDTLMMRATVKLVHEKSTATGFVLRRSPPRENAEMQSVLVTAAHVLEKTPGDETTLVYRIREAEGIYKRETMPLAIRKSGKPLWTQHPGEDIAVIVISPPTNVDLSTLSADLLANDNLLREQKVHPGQTVVCLGYPHRTEANGAAFPILRTGPIASYPLIPAAANRTFLLSANTFEGDSGAPIYLADSGRPFENGKANDKRLILGMMHGQHFLDEEMVMIYGTSKVRHRLGLGIVVQAAFIRETLDRLP